MSANHSKQKIADLFNCLNKYVDESRNTPNTVKYSWEQLDMNKCGNFLDFDFRNGYFKM